MIVAFTIFFIATIGALIGCVIRISRLEKAYKTLRELQDYQLLIEKKVSDLQKTISNVEKISLENAGKFDPVLNELRAHLAQMITGANKMKIEK